MSPTVRVQAIDALIAWKDALCVFQAAALEALVSADMEIRRTSDWLEERRRWWEDELRRREDAVTHAKAELTRKKMLPIIGKHPDTSDEEKRLRRAVAQLEEAAEKVKQTKRWGPLYQRGVEEYQAIARRLGAFLEMDLAKAIQGLGRRIESLEAYLEVTPPARPTVTSKPPDERTTP